MPGTQRLPIVVALFAVAALGSAVFVAPARAADPPTAGVAKAPAPVVYQLRAVEAGTVLDQKGIAGIDARTPPWPKEGAFQIGDIPTAKGANTVYRFMAVRWGAVSTSPDPARIHDLLLVEVAKDGTVVAAAHYTLEWQDVPSLRLYVAAKTGMKLTDGFDVAALGLTNVGGETFGSGGVLDFVLGARRAAP